MIIINIVMAPSIFVPGNLVATSKELVTGSASKVIYGPSQADLDSKVPLNYLMEIVERNLPKRGMKHRVMILHSSTGSGKSTAIPPELFHRFFTVTDRRNVVCTQPRALTAKEMPGQITPFHSADGLRAAGTPNRTPLILGQNIGYQTGPATLSAGRGINFVTTGILMRQIDTMTAEEFMDKYAFILIDEAHDRSMQLDTLLWLLRRFLQAHGDNPKCPYVFVMSATFNPFAMADYMLGGLSERERYESIVYVRGAVYVKEDNYLAYDCTNLSDAVRDIITSIVKDGSADLQGEFRDILIFVNGPSLDRKFAQLIDDLNANHPAFKSAPVRHVYLHSKAVATNNEDYQAVFLPYSKLRTTVRGKLVPASRRVIVATNVAETGLTLETLRYMIATGMYTSKKFNPVYACDVIGGEPITLGMWKQQFGRVGRKAPGFGYALFTRECRDKLLEDVYPNIMTDDITSELLTIITNIYDPKGVLKVDTKRNLSDDKLWSNMRKITVDLTKLDLLTLPPADSLQYSLERLYVLGAIDGNTQPTQFGFILNAMDKIGLQNSVMMLSAYCWDVAPIDMLNLAFMAERCVGMVLGNVLANKCSEMHRMWRKLSGYDDFVDLLITYLTYQEANRGGRRASYIKGGCGDAAEDEEFNDIAIWGGSDMFDYVGSGPLELTDEQIYRHISTENEFRDNYLTCMAKVGLNPFEDIGKSAYAVKGDSEDVIAWLRGLKRCIYEGYKLNLSEWNGTHYQVIRTGVTFKRAYCGHFVVFANMTYSRGEYSATLVSPLDGYVTVDKNFSVR